MCLGKQEKNTSFEMMVGVAKKITENCVYLVIRDRGRSRRYVKK
jgi:hypothetical protein